MNLLLDTCTLIWWTLDPEQLSEPASQALHKANRIKISAISIWEIGLKQKQGKLELGTSIEDYVRRLQISGLVSLEPVTVDVWLKNLSLDWSNRDPADRCIVATALLQDLTLVTADQAMAAFYELVLW